MHFSKYGRGSRIHKATISIALVGMLAACGRNLEINGSDERNLSPASLSDPVIDDRRGALGYEHALAERLDGIVRTLSNSIQSSIADPTSLTSRRLWQSMVVRRGFSIRDLMRSPELCGCAR